MPEPTSILMSYFMFMIHMNNYALQLEILESLSKFVCKLICQESQFKKKVDT